MDKKKPCTPAESLEQSLKELQSMRNGKLGKKSWNEFKQELNKEQVDKDDQREN